MADCEEPLELSAHSLAALQEFLSERQAQEEVEEQGEGQAAVKEDWQLSQFWYSASTAETLARAVVTAVGPGGRVACVSAPTLFKALKEKFPHAQADLFEFDKRFSFYGPEFHFYDYNSPLQLGDKELEHSFDLVFADPPFLSDECLTKTAVTCRLLAKEGAKQVLCSGAVMGELADRLLQMKLCKFQPKHENNLANQFQCYANFDLDALISEEER